MPRALLLLVLLPLPVPAAPRLKDRKPAPQGEAARVEGLRAKYDRVRENGTPQEREELAGEERLVGALIQLLDKVALEPPSQRRAHKEESVRARIESYGLRKDLYDIAMCDRKKVEGDK
jgi:hypothetical protein